MDSRARVERSSAIGLSVTAPRVPTALLLAAVSPSAAISSAFASGSLAARSDDALPVASASLSPVQVTPPSVRVTPKALNIAGLSSTSSEVYRLARWKRCESATISALAPGSPLASRSAMRAAPKSRGTNALPASSVALTVMG